MIVDIVALLAITAMGIPIALLLDRNARGGAVYGEAMLFGIGMAVAVLFLESIIGMRWSRLSLIAPLAITAGACAWLSRRSFSRLRAFDTFSPVAAVFSIVSATALFGYAAFATLAPPWEFDFLNDWGLKGRAFLVASHIDWTFLAQTYGRAVHPDYPLALPLTFDALAVFRGAWADGALGLVNVAFALALLLVVHRVAIDEALSREEASFLTLAILPFAASPWIGLAEGPFVAYCTAAILLLRQPGRSVAAAAVLLGLAASTKNEGLTLIVAIAIALAVSGRHRDIARLWPAIAIPLPWLVLRAAHGLQTDIASAGVFARMIEHIGQPAALLTTLARTPVGKPLFWIGVVIAIAAGGRALLRRERFALTAIALQFCFYAAAYLASPHDLDWHLRWSWDRLVSHLSPPLATVLLMNLLPLLRRRDPMAAAS